MFEQIIIWVIVIIFALLFLLFATRYKKCPSDKIMVVYGSSLEKNKDGTLKSSVCMHGGAKLVLPFIQGYQYLDLTPMSIQVDLKSALSRQNIRIDVPSRFTVGISTEVGVMQNAAERILGLRLNEIQELAKDIIFGQLRLVIATMDIEEINTDRDKFLLAVSSNVETELKKIGLRLINVNVTDINDESGYIQALGKDAAAKAINDAKRAVAEKVRDGSIGEAKALMDQRIQVADANQSAVKGENEALAKISQSNANRREVEAESLRRATTAEKVAEAKAREDAYSAEQQAELARAAREKATLEADILVRAEIEKQQIEISAEAQAEQIRREAKGEADGLFFKMQAQARGIEEILTRQALGFKSIVDAAGGSPNDAVKMMIAEKLENLVKTQVEAIKNIKIDKITVWDSGNGKGESSTSNFVSSLVKSIPPMQELFNMAGLDLPDYLAKKKDSGEIMELAPKGIEAKPSKVTK